MNKEIVRQVRPEGKMVPAPYQPQPSVTLRVSVWELKGAACPAKEQTLLEGPQINHLGKEVVTEERSEDV